MAEAEGRVVGSVQLAQSQEENARHRAEIQKLFVLSTLRGQGIASQLMAAAETAALAAGRTLLVLDTLAGSEAEPVYRHLGGRGQTEQEVTSTIRCGEQVQVIWKTGGVWFEPPAGPAPEPFWKPIQPDDLTIDDSESRTEPGVTTITETRKLHGVRE